MKAHVPSARRALLFPVLFPVLFGFLGLLGACSSRAPDRFVPKPPPRETGPIELGEFGSMTGTSTTSSLSAHRGLCLAVEEVNSSGGVVGRMLLLRTFDDQGRTDAAARAVERLENEDKPAALFALSPREIVESACPRVKDFVVVAPALDGAIKSGNADAPGFAAHFRARYGSDPDESASITYAAVRLLVEALGAAKSFACPDVVEALSTTATNRGSAHGLALHADAASKLVMHVERKPRD